MRMSGVATQSAGKRLTHLGLTVTGRDELKYTAEARAATAVLAVFRSRDRDSDTELQFESVHSVASPSESVLSLHPQPFKLWTS